MTLSRARYGIVWFWGVLVILGIMALSERVRAYLGSDFFWDLEVYTEAITVHRAGGNAYGDLGGLRYVYPPVVLFAMAALGEALAPLLTGLYALSLALLLARRMWIFTFCILLFAGLTIGMDDTFVRSMATGNLTLFAHIVLIWLLLSRWPHAPSLGFWVALGLLSLLKPYFLAYAAVPVLAIGMHRDLLVRAGATILISGAIWASQAWLFPDTYAAFLASLRAQVFQGSAGYITGDVGFGLYAFAALLVPDPKAALMLHGTAVGVCAILVLVWRHGASPDIRTSRVLLMAAIAVAILANPRLKIYDAWVLQAASVFVIIQVRQGWIQAIALSGLLAIYQSVPVPRGGDLLGPDFEVIRKFALGHLPWITAVVVVYLDRMMAKSAHGGHSEAAQAERSSR